MLERINGLNVGFLKAIKEEMDKREARERAYQDQKFSSLED